jgi:hypothetical protein
MAGNNEQVGSYPKSAPIFQIANGIDLFARHYGATEWQLSSVSWLFTAWAVTQSVQ